MKHIYFGDGKGKSTAAVGQAVRSAGRDMSVLFIQFLKSENSGERKILKSINNITVPPLPESCKLTFKMNNTELREAEKQAIKLLNLAKSSLGKFDVIVLDEIFSLLDAGFAEKEQIKNIMESCPEDTELILTGHSIPNEFIFLADYVSEIKKVSHPFDKGMTARIGIEY